MNLSRGLWWKIISICTVVIGLPGLGIGQQPATPARAPAAQPVAVADVLDATKGAVKPASGTIEFDGPAGGNDRMKSKGILLKAKPTPQSGSTWEFTYRRTGYHLPIQIIHPFADGQVIVSFSRNKVGLAAVKEWTELGYAISKTFTDVVEKTEQFSEVFPLLEGDEYHIVSRLGADGVYQLQINGKPVANATVRNAFPLSLEIPAGKRFPLGGMGFFPGYGATAFEGKNLPLQWSAGWAALLLGSPSSVGNHVCRLVKYHPDSVAPASRPLAKAIRPANPPPAAPSRPALAPAAAPAPLPENNILPNGSFQYGTTSWSIINPDEVATIAVDPNETHDGRPSMKIESLAEPVWVFVQYPANKLKPSTRYRISAWIKTKGIAKGDGQMDGGGARLYPYVGTNIEGNTQDLLDAKDWTFVTSTFSTGSEARANVTMEFGNWRKWIRGTAWFADISLVELDAIAKAPGAPFAPSTPGPQAAPPAVPTLVSPLASDLVSKHRSNLVFVTMPDGAGSGFIANYSNGTYLFTNAHVAAGSKGAVFRTLEGSQVQVGAPAAAAGHDIFLMALKQGGSPLQLMTKVDETARIGDEVVVLGNAEGAGVINTIVGRIVGLGPNLVEVDAPFQPGNSGSPIIHLKTGNVVGVATYLTIRKYDTATRAAIKEPVIRRFGYRLDSVKKWEPVNWQAFNAQAAELESIEKLTKDLVGFLRDLGEDGKVSRSAHSNPIISRRIDVWLEAKRKGLSARDSAAADQSFLSFLKSTCQSDIIASQQRTTYDYFRRQLTDIQKERTEIAGVFEKILADIRQ
jgi:hypothetical protein